jgi:hypothetical protein
MLEVRFIAHTKGDGFYIEDTHVYARVKIKKTLNSRNLSGQEHNVKPKEFRLEYGVKI